MKRTLIITLALALALGTAAMAETVPTEAAAVASTEEVVQEQATAGETDDSEASVTFEDALKALRDARQEARQDELDGYVAAGKLTQEQADVILKQFSDKTDQKRGQKHNRRGDRQRGHGWQQNGKQGGNQMPQQDDQRMPQGGQRMPQGGQLPPQGGQQMPGGQMPQRGKQMPPQGGQLPQQGGQQIPDANSSATPQMPGNGQQEQQPRMGGQQMPGNHR